MSDDAEVSFERSDLKNRTVLDLDQFETDYVQAQIDDAIALIEEECPTVPDRLASGALSPSAYKRVVADVVLRILNNPLGRQSESEGGFSVQMGATTASGDLWLTEKDLSRLNGTKKPFTLPGTASIGLTQ